MKKDTMISEIKEGELPAIHAWTYPESSDAERVRRWRNIRESMERLDIDCLLIPGSDANQMSSSKNVLYVSNYVTYSGRTYVIFPRDGEKEPFLSLGHPDGGMPHQRYVPAKYHSWIKSMSAAENQSNEVLNHVKRIGLEKGRIGIIDPNLFPGPFYEKLHGALPEARFEIATKVLTSLRAFLSDEEIRMIREAARILDLSYEAAVGKASPGIQEFEIWGAIENAIIGNGGFTGHGNLITSLRNPVFPLSPPSHRVLEKGDTILAETSSIWGGYTAQLAYAFSLGEPEEELTKMHNLCTRLYDEAIALFNDGRSYRQVKEFLDKEVFEAGYWPMSPQIHLDLGEQEDGIKPRQHFVLHPCAVTRDYRFGMKVGDHVMVDGSGKATSLMKTSHEFKKLNL